MQEYDNASNDETIEEVRKDKKKEQRCHNDVP
jgi:hypothetical protein